MRILSVGYPLLPVRSDSAGGAEQILHLLDCGLVERDIQSTVIAASGSLVRGELIETPAARAEITDEDRLEAQQIHAKVILDAFEERSVDLIHFHGLDFETYLPNRLIPKLVTIHLPISWYSSELFDRKDVHFVCVSKTQAGSIPANNAVRARVIINGVNASERVIESDRTSLLWIGRICPEKGVHIALNVAHGLGLPLTIAGPVHPFSSHRAYYREQVAPLLDDKRVHVGPVNPDEKAELLQKTCALLIPSLVAETSSLVAMEAAHAGVPVIGFRAGALPEVIEDGVTGFIVDGEDEMVAAMKRIGDISPIVCRERARLRFSANRMVDDYVNFYREILGA